MAAGGGLSAGAAGAAVRGRQSGAAPQTQPVTRLPPLRPAARTGRLAGARPRHDPLPERAARLQQVRQRQGGAAGAVPQRPGPATR